MFVSFFPPVIGSLGQGLYCVPEGPSHQPPTWAELMGAGVEQLFPLTFAQPMKACLLEMLRLPPTYTGAFTPPLLAMHRLPPTYNGTLIVTPWLTDVSQVWPVPGE